MTTEEVSNSKEICNKSESNFYEEIVKNLQLEAKKLNEKLTTAMCTDNMNLYIATIKSLRETLDLISKYNWRLHYSEYGVMENGERVGTQVSVWEQNHECQIRNNLVWNVVDRVK
jgi:hypothetical protein